MKRLVIDPRFLGFAAVAALLAGCSGSELRANASDAIPQMVPAVEHAYHGKPWMLSDAKASDLVYVVNDRAVDVFSYPQGKQVGLLTVNATGGLCSDRAGDVFVTDFSDSQIIEYAHGGKTPIDTLYPHGQPSTCSVDPTTGNLATVVLVNGGTLRVSIFKNASGHQRKYAARGIWQGSSCSYDDDGSLYVSASSDSEPFFIEELPYDGKKFTRVPVNGDFAGGNPLQWDGKYIAVPNGNPKKPLTVFQVKISGSTGNVVGTTSLRGSSGYQWPFWIQNGIIFHPMGHNARNVGAWQYPVGGKPFLQIRLPNGTNERAVALGITLSVAQ